MSFVVTYAETAFTSKNPRVNPSLLRQEIVATAAITDTLEAIRIAERGTQTAESASATGRTWAIQFAGAGPLAGGGAAALDALVAAHVGNAADADATTPVGHIQGCTIAYASTSTVTVGVGRIELRTASESKMFAIGSPITVSTASTGAGALDAGTLTASNWYYAWVIGSRSGQVSAVLSLSATTPTMPSGYQFRRRLGSVRVNSVPAIADFISLGTGVVRRYWDNAGDSWRNIANASSVTTQTAFGGGGSTALPVTAIETTLQISTNATSPCLIKYNGQGSVTVATMRASATNEQIVCPLVAGQGMYYNSVASGSTTIRMIGFIEEVG